MRNGFKVFDADAHVVYPRDLWSRYLDDKHKHRVGAKQPGGSVFLHVTTDWAAGSSGAAVLDEYGNAIGHVASTRTLLWRDENRHSPTRCK